MIWDAIVFIMTSLQWSVYVLANKGARPRGGTVKHDFLKARLAVGSNNLNYVLSTQMACSKMVDDFFARDMGFVGVNIECNP